MRRVSVKLSVGALNFGGALRVTPHAAARVAVAAMMVLRCVVGMMSHAFKS